MPTGHDSFPSLVMPYNDKDYENIITSVSDKYFKLGKPMSPDAHCWLFQRSYITHWSNYLFKGEREGRDVFHFICYFWTNEYWLNLAYNFPLRQL